MVPFGDLLLSSLTNLAMNLPLLIAWLVGIVIAIVRWKQAPRKSLLTLLALVVLMVTRVIAVIFSNSFFVIASTNGMPIQTMTTISIVVNIILGLIDAGAWVLLLMALFGKPKKDPELA